MGLDIYVMPLWRFLAQDFEMVIERDCKRLGTKPPKLVTEQGLVQRPQRPPDAYRINTFKRKARNVQERVAEGNRPTPINWNDEGECVYGERCADRGMQSLRTYALWLSRKDSPTLTPPPDDDFYKHPIWQTHKPGSTSFSHLIDHDCYSSYYLPCDFEKVTNVEKISTAAGTGHRVAASAFQLQRELREVTASIESNAGLESLPENHSNAIRQACAQMNLVAGLSCKQGLPIIFWG